MALEHTTSAYTLHLCKGKETPIELEIFGFNSIAWKLNI